MCENGRPSLLQPPPDPSHRSYFFPQQVHSPPNAPARHNPVYLKFRAPVSLLVPARKSWRASAIVERLLDEFAAHSFVTLQPDCSV